MVEVKKSFLLAILVILLVGLVAFGLNDTTISLADTGVPNNEITSSVSKASNSTAGAAITITMYAMADE